MKIYLASKTDNFKRVQEVRNVFEQRGHEITFDWTKHEIADNPSAGVDGTMTEERRRECARNDLKGVLSADALVMLTYPNLCGTLIEVGLAIAWDIPVFILGELERNSVFFALPRIEQIPEGVDFVSHVEHNRSLLMVDDGPPVS